MERDQDLFSLRALQMKNVEMKRYSTVVNGILLHKVALEKVETYKKQDWNFPSKNARREKNDFKWFFSSKGYVT